MRDVPTGDIKPLHENGNQSDMRRTPTTIFWHPWPEGMHANPNGLIFHRRSTHRSAWQTFARNQCDCTRLRGCRSNR